jgi:CubicO group peptidase (beta-lactamase class C family)
MRDTGFLVSDAQLPRFTVLYGPGMAPVEQPSQSDYRDPNRLLDGGGAISGTADDYLRFAQMLANGGALKGTRLLSERSVGALFEPRGSMGGMGPQTMQFGYGFSIGDPASEASGMQPAGTASWSGSGNTYFFVDRRRRAVALLMTHVLGSSGTVRASVNRAATALIGK